MNIGKLKQEKTVGYFRNRAHKYFDKLWQNEGMTRVESYEWLATSLKMPIDDCHMSKMSISICKEVIELSKQLLTDLIDLDRHFGVYR